LPQTLFESDASRAAAYEQTREQVRIVFLTPLMGGADGISEMTRQWVHVVESRVGGEVRNVEVWSLDDEQRPSSAGPVSRFKTARGGRVRFASFAFVHGIASAADTIVVVMHLQLLPVALPLIWRGARLVTILMGIEAWTPLDAAQKAAMRAGWKTIAISAHTANRFRAANPAMTDLPITVCPPGVPAMPRPAAALVERPYALIVGRMDARERYKGHDTLIEVWPSIRRTVADARLVVVGDGDDAARLRQKADETCDGIVFVGRVDESKLAALYRDAAFFVMPSTEEGFGLVYLEAMRSAIPCIAAHGAAEEIITDGRDGLIVNAGDRDELVAAIVHLFVDRQARMRMGAAAVQRVNAHFDRPALERRVCAALELGTV
jgi:phosphatidylinositol alpha-1,6-mannosyltransferase